MPVGSGQLQKGGEIPSGGGNDAGLHVGSSNQLVRQTGLLAPTVNAALADLAKMSLVEKITGRKRGRVFSYRRYLVILSEGTEPLPAGS